MTVNEELGRMWHVSVMGYLNIQSEYVLQK